MPPDARIGYCTNVHAGTDIATIRRTLAEHAAVIAARRRQKRPDAGPLGVGLWIPASAADQLVAPGGAEAFAAWLAEHDLYPLTINGFPFDNFHLPVVKHRVYRPAWWEPERLEYTLRLVELLQRMMPAGDQGIGSISTLPLGWPGPAGRSSSVPVETSDAACMADAGRQLRSLAEGLQRIEQQSGRRIIVAVEPEPGCLIDRAGDLVAFFDRELAEANHRRYLGVCHDVCHSAVMFESQGEALAAYARAGIAVGKVQISSAVDVPFQDFTPPQREAAVAELSRFAEDRYLHQTGIRTAAGEFRLVEDLPQWLDERRGCGDAAECSDHLRIHFHLPVYREQFGQLRSTQGDILQCIEAIQGPDAPEFTGHYEVETYAWTVLPEEVRNETLAEGIALELEWFEEVLSQDESSRQRG